MSLDSPPAIFFDAVGTLFGIQGTVGEIYRKAAARHGLTGVDPVALDRAFYLRFAGSPPAAFPGVDPQGLPHQERAWWRQVVQGSFTGLGIQIPADFPGFDTCFQEVYELFATRDPWYLYPETVEVLEQLCGMGIPLGLISNFDTRLYGVLKDLGIREYFQCITLSTEVGAAKPSPLVFETALKQMGIPTGWHIGDSLEQDYRGAVAAGLSGLWLDREGSLKASAGVPTMGSLTEVLSYLGSSGSVLDQR